MNGLGRHGRILVSALCAGAMASSLVVAATTQVAGASGTSSPILLGASLSMTGPLGVFGVDQHAGYAQEIADVNRQGGIKIDGHKHKVKLIYYNNKSTPTTASEQIRNLVLKDGVVALLGAGTPTITVPEGLAATTLHVPYLTTNTPTHAFTNGNSKGWKYSWDMFFTETEQAKDTVAAVDRFKTNHKVALFTNNEPDGIVERPLYVKDAQAKKDKVVGNYSFPVGTTTYTSFIETAKSHGAQIVIGQMLPPTAIALWKQMKSLNFSPKIAQINKAADFVSWVTALGSLAQGSLLEAVWLPTWHYPGTHKIEATLAKKFPDKNLGDVGTAVAAYSVADVMLHAIEKANTTKATAVNAALARTKLTTTYGKVHFRKTHTSPMRYAVAQWQGKKTVPVWPAVKKAHLQFPMHGLS